MTAASPGIALRRAWAERPGIASALTTVDHKRIGRRYLATAMAFFAVGGVEALLIRVQLARPEERLLRPEAYDQIFTMHGLTMIFLFVTPLLSGFGNFVIPLMLGARDMAFPRVNALSYWVYLAAGLFMYTGLLIGRAPDAGWFSYAPLSGPDFTPGVNTDFYGLGLIFLGISTTAGAINIIVTTLKLRAPGMSIDRIPLFVWAWLATALAIVFAIPALTTAALMLELERLYGFHFFDTAAGGDPVLWQHLFWIFGHPDVYIIFLPAVGIVSTVIPVFSGRPMVVHNWVVMSTLLTGLLGFGVWVHHMFAVGLPQLSITFFAAASLIIAVPSGIQVFAWIATMLTGRPRLVTPMLYAVGFIVVFVVGGITGVMFAAIPFDQQVTDSYFVVAHFHYVLFGGAVFPILAGLHHWWPKITGRLTHERAGAVSFWLVFAGFNVTFFPMHISGLLGMPRRVYTYPRGMGWDALNLISTLGAVVLAAGLLVVLANLVWSLRAGPEAGPDPWGADTLEWAAQSPPEPYNFTRIPVVRSANPLWDPPLPHVDDPLAGGHRTPETSLGEGDPQRILRMPEESWLPLCMALSLAVVFTGLITTTTVVIVLGGLLVGLVVAGWARPGAQEAPA